MLDTVTLGRDWSLRNKLPHGRRLSLSGVTVRVASCGTRLQSAEASLPRLLFGHNGQVIETQEQLDAAFKRFAEILDPIVHVPDMADWQPWRVDMAWNFDYPARPLVLAHAALRIPGIRRTAALFGCGDGVSWAGGRSRFVVRLYDKSRKMRVPGSVLRAEISLRGEQLTRRLHGRDWRDIGVMYRFYREIMATIPPVQRPTAAANWQEAVGAESHEIRQRILARLAHRPDRTYRRMVQRVEAAAANLPEEFSWAKVLPPDTPPPAVNVVPRRLPAASNPHALHSSCRLARAGNTRAYP